MNKYITKIRALGRKVRYRFLDPFPANVHFAVTNRCNLSCVFCGQDKSFWKQDEELTGKDYRRVIDELGTMGGRTVSLSGGEIFLHNEILDILNYCSFKKQHIGMLLTNGTLVSEEVARTLVTTGVGHVGFSIDGTREAHDLLRGMTGCHQRVIEAIRLIDRVKKERNCHTPTIGINYVITPENAGVLDAVIELFPDLAISSIRFQFLTYISDESLRRHKEDITHLAPDLSRSYWEGFRRDFAPIDGYAVAEKIKKVRKAAAQFGIRVYLSHDLGATGIVKWYGSNEPLMRHCVFPYQSFLILPNGDVPLCDFVRCPVGNVSDHRLVEIWRNEKWRQFRQERLRGLLPGCERCCQLT